MDDQTQKNSAKRCLEARYLEVQQTYRNLQSLGIQVKNADTYEPDLGLVLMPCVEAADAEELAKKFNQARELWARHQSTKHKQDGSHFQVDIELNALLGPTQETKK